MKVLDHLRSLIQGTFMMTKNLKEKVKESFNQWLYSTDKALEEREELRQKVYLQAEMVLKREDLRARDRRNIEMILKIVE